MVAFATDVIVLSQIFIVDDSSDAPWLVGDLLERYVNAAFPRRTWGHVVRVCMCVSVLARASDTGCVGLVVTFLNINMLVYVGL